MYRQTRFAVSALTAALLSAVALDLPASEQHSSPPANPTAPGSAVELASGSGGPAGMTEQKLRDAYGKLPLAFVPNAGHSDARVRFSAQAGGAAFYFTQREAVFAFRKGSPGPSGGVVLRLAFLGANPGTTIEGERLETGKVNYLIGSDPSAWRTGLPTYGQVVYRDLWPGVDMVFRGDGSRLKYEFVIRPGAKVEDIQLAYRGAKRLSVDRAGQLLIRTALGTLKDERPLSYQEVGGRRRPVESRFLLGQQATAYGFAVGAYDPRQPLVIDPGIAYSTYLGGNNSDIGNPIVVDSAGNAYVTGETDSTTFPTTSGAFDTSSVNGMSFDAFVTKLNAAGSGLVYSTYLGGSAIDRGFGIAIDTVGNAYVTGQTDSANFPTTLLAFDTSYNGNTDAFVTLLNDTGSALMYSTFLGGTANDEGHAIAVDTTGAYVTGQTNSNNFPTTLGAFDTSHNNGVDAFVTKLTMVTPIFPLPPSSALLYSTYLGGAQSDIGSDIAVDGDGSAYVTGQTNSSAFPTTVGAFDTSQNGNDDVFVTKLNAAGSAPLLYSTFLGGSQGDRGFGIALDARKNAYVTGETGSSNFPTTAGAFDTTHNGGSLDAFVTKLNATGSAPLEYSTYLGGSGSTDQGFGIAVDVTGNAYVTGGTNSTNFPTTAGAFDTTYNSGGDAFVTKLNAAGSAPLLYSTFLGGSSSDEGHGIAVDASNSAYVTGRTTSDNFPTTAGAFDTIYNTDGDAFVTKLDTGCATDSDCSDGNACTTDTCVAGVCVNANNTLPCQDGFSCTAGDICSGGTCQSGTASDVSCQESPDNVCTTNTCAPTAPGHDPATGCVSANNTNSCSDGFSCTAGDICSGGVCTGVPNNAACDDDDVCTDDSCDPESGCVHMDNANSCDDDNECTAGDTCSGGTCEPGTTAVACKVTGGGGLTNYGDNVCTTNIPEDRRQRRHAR